MGVQADVKTALDGDRDDLLEALATHRLLPTVVDRGDDGGSGLLGRSSGPTIKLEPAGDAGSLDRQTTVLVVDALGLESEADCEAVQDELTDHPAWE